MAEFILLVKKIHFVIFRYTTLEKVEGDDLESEFKEFGNQYQMDFSEEWVNFNQIGGEFSTSLHYFPKLKQVVNCCLLQ